MEQKDENNASFLEVRKYLYEAMKKKGYSCRSLSLLIGRTDSYLHRFIQYGNPRFLDADDRMRIAAILEVDERKLTDKKDPILPAHLSGVIAVADKMKSFFTSKDEVAIDILNVSACCGSGEDVIDEDVLGRFVVPNDHFRSISLTSSPKNVKMIRAVGDSMSPTINDEDWCLVDLSLNSLVSDGIYLIRSKSGVAIKRLQRGYDDDVFIKSDNPCYDTANKSLTDIDILGRIIYIMNGRKV